MKYIDGLRLLYKNIKNYNNRVQDHEKTDFLVYYDDSLLDQKYKQVIQELKDKGVICILVEDKDFK